MKGVFVSTVGPPRLRLDVAGLHLVAVIWIVDASMIRRVCMAAYTLATCQGISSSSCLLLPELCNWNQEPSPTLSGAEEENVVSDFRPSLARLAFFFEWKKCLQKLEAILRIQVSTMSVPYMPELVGDVKISFSSHQWSVDKAVTIMNMLTLGSRFLSHFISWTVKAKIVMNMFLGEWISTK